MPPLAIIGAVAGSIGSGLSAHAAGPRLTPIPPPAPLYPQLNSQFISGLATSGPAAEAKIGQIAQNPLDPALGAFGALLNAQARQVSQGRANIRESFGAGGLRFSSSAQTAAVDFEAQTSKNFIQILADYLRQAQSEQLAAAEFQAQEYASAATTTYPTAALTSGAPSTAGSALSSGGNSLILLSLIKAMGGFK